MEKSNLNGFKYKGSYYAAWEDECQEIFADLAACNGILDECMRKERIAALEAALQKFIIK